MVKTELVAPTARSRREERAIAFFGSWMIAGLFLDGWAHEAERPETFFSPWHGILYSGFVAAITWFAWDGRRAGKATTRPVGASDRLATLGLVVFVVGAVGDGLWHEIFGIEVDLEALVSPSHLALLLGGFLMVSSPVRTAALDAAETEPRWADWYPQAVTITLATALVAFFTLYLSPFRYAGATWGATGRERELSEVVSLASVLAANLILVSPSIYILRRWRPPMGTFTLLFTAVAVGLAGLRGFELIELALAFLVGGVVADVLTRARFGVAVVAGGAAAALWTTFFGVADLSYGVDWSVELWSGAIVLATACSLLAAGLTRPR